MKGVKKKVVKIEEGTGLLKVDSIDTVDFDYPALIALKDAYFNKQIFLQGEIDDIDAQIAEAVALGFDVP